MIDAGETMHHDDRSRHEIREKGVEDMMMITTATMIREVVVASVGEFVSTLPRNLTASIGDKRRDYSSSGSDSRSPRRDRPKSMGEQALAALGIGGAASAALTGRSKSHDRGDRSSRGSRGGRSRRYSDESSSRSRSRGRGNKGADPREKMIQAARAAVLAGGAEAWRMRKEPGGWGGPKGRRVLTAAVGAAGINGLVDKNPEKGGTMHTIEAVIGGLAGNRLLNGSRKDEESGSRSRSRGRGDKGGSGGGIAGLGAGALAAAAGKAFMDRAKSKDRGSGRRSYSSSDDSRGGGRPRRSKSVSDYMRQGMGALGIGGNTDKRETIDRGTRRDLGNNKSENAPPSRPRGGGDDGGDGIRSSHGSSSNNSSSEDDVSSSEEERERKKMGHKQLITAGLASVATIHAAHSIYQSVHMRQVRMKEVAEGELSPQEARKKKNKGRMQNVAAVGVAALGVKGAYSEWKEMKEQRDEAHEFDAKRAKRHERRLEKLSGRDSGGTTENGSTYSGQSTPGHGYGHPNAYGNGSLYMDVHEQYRSSAPNLTSDPNAYYGEPSGPHYSDGNPYQTGGLPPPPMGPPQQQY